MIDVRVRKRFPAAAESDGFSLDVTFQARSGITVLYGASGAGKTLTLDCIAGFAKPDAGRILLDDQILFDAAAQVHLPARARRCGYVLQDYALFPNMTVRENLAFGAERRPRLDRHRHVTEMLERFRLSDVAGRYPQEISGGQKQRCSIARALISGPRMLLLDEPTRGLDSALREDLYGLLRELRSEYSIPMLLVTHDWDECFTLGDSVLVYGQGVIIQAGPPSRVMDQPVSAEVAQLLGISNLFRAEILALDPGRNTSRIRLLGQELTGTYFPGRLLGDQVTVCIRPENLRLHTRMGENRLPLQVERVLRKPSSVRVEFAGGVTVETAPPDDEQMKENKQWMVEFPPEALRVVG